ncbi:MAG: nitrous oxide-stimulated promoter family protein [Elusimicrobiales bacterium]|nr:nitrous oxide-stimulated promoter family protein [Elusimicrobiales bacterium]
MEKDLEAELRTIELMLAIYCRGKHGGKTLCAGCAELLAYAEVRLAKCPHHPKPACKNCPTHCYLPAKRELMREVMKYAGPRMPLRHPLLTLKHYFKK